MGLLGTLEEKNDRPNWRTVVKPIIDQVVEPPARDPIPCLACRSPLFWLDAFGTTRCLDCEPPPARSLVRWPLWGIAGPPGGPWWWETLEEPPRRFGADNAREMDEEQTDSDCRQVVEHTFHWRRFLSVVGSGERRDRLQMCAILCWQ